jgi:hypothetical protein
MNLQLVRITQTRRSRKTELKRQSYEFTKISYRKVITLIQTRKIKYHKPTIQYYYHVELSNTNLTQFERVKSELKRINYG